MKSAVSVLNPHAEAYIPLSLRDTSNKSLDSSATAALNFHGTEKSPPIEDLKQKGQQIDAQKLNETMNKDLMVEDFEMDLAYLQMTFPDVSEQSLVDVYQANECDLDAAIDMLAHLEPSIEIDRLPEALDIGDIPAGAATSTTAGECSSSEVKHAVGEPSSSSGSSKLAVAS